MKDKNVFLFLQQRKSLFGLLAMPGGKQIYSGLKIITEINVKQSGYQVAKRLEKVVVGYLLQVKK